MRLRHGAARESGGPCERVPDELRGRAAACIVGHAAHSFENARENIGAVPQIEWTSVDAERVLAFIAECESKERQ
jgi:hypothetical protein